METDTTLSWSDATLKAIDKYFEEVKFTYPILEERVELKLALGTRRGADVRLTLRDLNERKHRFLVEAEQYASGSDFEDKLKTWASRHCESEETTTVIISLVSKALRNRLIEVAKNNNQVNDMILSNHFRIIPGIGDGTLGQAFRDFLLRWIDAKMEAFG